MNSSIGGRENNNLLIKNQKGKCYCVQFFLKVNQVKDKKKLYQSHIHLFYDMVFKTQAQQLNTVEEKTTICSSPNKYINICQYIPKF